MSEIMLEIISEENTKVNRFVLLIKKVLLKSKERINLNKTVTDLPFPPIQIMSWWGTFLQSFIFYLYNFHIIKDFILQLDDCTRNVAETKLW